MATGGALKGLAGLGAVLVGVVGLGALAGFGPLAGPLPPDQVRDPREMIARGLQAVLDSTSVHVEGTVDGSIPGGLLDRDEAAVTLDGTTVAADVLPKEARTRAHVDIPALDVALDTTSVWDALWYRTEAEGDWIRASVGGVAADAGVDVNPLTLVDRLRSYLARPGITPTATDVPCPGAGSTPCRHVVLDAGNDPAALLAVMLPDDAAAALPPTSTLITFDAEVATLRPVRVAIEMASADGAVDLELVLVTSRWDDPSITIPEPSGA